MIISHRFKFIFIKNLKTAGSSIETYLSPLCGEEDVFTRIVPTEGGHVARNFRGFFSPLSELMSAPSGHPTYPNGLGVIRQALARWRFYNHMPAVSVRARVPKNVWDGYFKFCVERDPFTKTMSMFRMLEHRGVARDLDHFFSIGRFPSDWNRYSDYDGTPIVDEILRYEDLDDELARVFGRLGVPFEGSLTVQAKSLGRVEQVDPRSSLSASQRERIQHEFEREFEHLGYER